MDKGILPPELKSVEALFTGDIRYTVPRYQRSFAWTEDEIEEMWEDLTRAARRGTEYFLGTIVLQQKGPGNFEIIDGQQRMACLTMLFSAVRNVFLASRDDRAVQIRDNFIGAKGYARDAKIMPKLVLNKVNNEFFVQHVVSSDNLDAVRAVLKTKHLKTSNKLLLEAYLYFLAKVSGEAASMGTQSDDFLVPLIDCLRMSVKLITITVLSGEDANLFFESLNARGKELAVSDLVKNRLFSEAGEQVDRAEPLWEGLEAELARKSIPDYLRHYWIAKKATENNLIVREKHLYRLIVEDVRDNQGKALALLNDLSTSSAEYVKINDYSLWPNDDAYDASFGQSISDLQIFRVTQCYPLLLNVIQIFQAPKEIAKVFRIVANFSFRYFIIGNQSPGNLERESNKIAFGIRNGSIVNSRDIADAFRAINPDPAFRKDFSLATLPKARAKLARYTLGKLNNHLSANARKQGAEIVVNPDAKEVNLEHVLPQSVPIAWKSYFSKDVTASDYVYRIGNLTLLTKKTNNDIGDSTFPDKQREAFMDSTLPINEIFKTLTKWGDGEIESRQDALAKTALDVWGL